MNIPPSYELEIRGLMENYFTQDPLLSQYIDFSTKRIYRGDSGTVSNLQSPKIVLLNWRTDDNPAAFGRPGGGSRDLKIGLACAVYAYMEKERVSRDSNQEEEAKDIVTSYSGIIREAIYRTLDIPGVPWYDVIFHSPATEYDTNESYQRGVTYFYACCRATNQEI